MQFNAPLKEVIEVKLQHIEQLTAIRNEQAKLFEEHKYADGKTQHHCTNWQKYEELEKQIPPSLYSLYGYNAEDKAGKQFSTWEIQLQNDPQHLKQLLQTQL